MYSLKNKIVLITGASSGIGKACAFSFAKEGAKLILTARRDTLLKEIQQELKEEFNTNSIIYSLDVRSYKQVEEIFGNLPKDFQDIDILINNAGLGKGLNKFQDGKVEDWDVMIDTNVKGLLYVTRVIVPKMIERKSGHIINIGSIAGHAAYPKGNVYCASKFAVDAITKSLRIDLLGYNIRVSTVDPGMVETNFSNVRFEGDTEKAKMIYKGLTPLVAEDISEAVLFCATRPLHVNIGQIVLTPTSQVNAVHIHREES